MECSLYWWECWKCLFSDPGLIHNSCHGNQLPKVFLDPRLTILCYIQEDLWNMLAMSMSFAHHGNSCQGNRNPSIFQPLWSKGPPARQISWESGRKQLQESVTIIRSVLYYISMLPFQSEIVWEKKKFFTLTWSSYMSDVRSSVTCLLSNYLFWPICVLTLTVWLRIRMK